MSLTEFLAARIADDRGRIVHEFDCDRFEVYDYGTRRGTCDCDASKQLWAECEAKRRIVADREHLAGVPGHGHMLSHADWILRQLAAVYADHPDYREEWKP